MITVKYNIDFKRVLKELEQEKLEDTLNEGVADKFAKNSLKFIKAGKVEPELSENNPRGEDAPPLYDTGKLAKSLKGSKEGIKGVTYGKKHYQKGGYTWKKKVFLRGKEKTLNLKVPQRKFITADYPSEKSANNKIYKEFQKKFVRLLNKRIRKK